MLVKRLLKTLAIPLVLFAIVQAILKTPISGRQGRKLLLICAANVTVALTLGLLIMNTLQPGKYWSDSIAGMAGATETMLQSQFSTAKPTLHPLKNLAGYIPENLLQPFLSNNIISVILVALLAGFALRKVKEKGPDAAAGILALEQIFRHVTRKIFERVESWPGGGEWVVRRCFCSAGQSRD